MTMAKQNQRPSAAMVRQGSSELERLDMRTMILLALMACGGAVEPTTHDVTLTVAPPAATYLPVTVVPDSGGCMQCIGDTLWDICPATPERQPDADSCNLCGGHCDGG